jgi:hypothetical protein
VTRSRPGSGGVVVLFALLLVVQAGCRTDPAFRRPNLICAGQGGKTLAIYDSRRREILVTDREFRLRCVIRHSGFSNLWGMDADDRQIVVANQRTLGYSRNPAEKRAMAVAELLFFDFHGTLRRSWTWTGETGPVIDPRAVQFMRDGTILVSDIRVNQIVRLASDGTLLQRIATYGFDPGQVFYPNDIRETPSGTILVVDSFNCRVQEFSPDGRVVRTAGTKGSGPDGFLFPQHAAHDASGSWYVTDLANQRVAVLDPDLAFRGFVQIPAQQKHSQLFDVCVLADPPTLLVADSHNSRIHVLVPNGDYQRPVTEVIP